MSRALISVYDKTGLLDLAGALVSFGWELVASGGTARYLAEADLPVTPVERITNQPEMLSGRVKTLHPAIFAGILARETDTAELSKFDYGLFDLVVCNLYPFKETISRQDATLDDAVEHIDVGGVSLLRAAAKNFQRVVVLCDPADYENAFAMYKMSGYVDLPTRRGLAAKAFNLTQQYDAMIYDYLDPNNQPDSIALDSNGLPRELSLSLRPNHQLRYGENPHQQGAYYGYYPERGPLGGKVLGGKTLSYNNMLDLDAAWRAVEMYQTPAVVIVKHLNPAGIATGKSISEAFPAALACDPLSAFGGVIAVNQVVDEKFISALGDLFVEAIAAPDFTSLAQETMNIRRKNCRLLRIDANPAPQSLSKLEVRSVRGGLLLQTQDAGDPQTAEWRVVSKRQPTDDENEAMRFAWLAAQAVKSNAIVLATAKATVGIGGGLSSRVDAAKLAVSKAGHKARGAAMASDAFFPFPDGLQVGIDAGISAAIAPGGSVRDEEVIAAADAADVVLVFTGVRHFRH
jgi:phosphoribosylaminoimidazolecarboxamide formyltransferase / IMP cyclohydrolase